MNEVDIAFTPLEITIPSGDIRRLSSLAHLQNIAPCCSNHSNEILKSQKVLKFEENPMKLPNIYSTKTFDSTPTVNRYSTKILRSCSTTPGPSRIEIGSPKDVDNGSSNRNSTVNNRCSVHLNDYKLQYSSSSEATNSEKSESLSLQNLPEKLLEEKLKRLESESEATDIIDGVEDVDSSPNFRRLRFEDSGCSSLRNIDSTDISPEFERRSFQEASGSLEKTENGLQSRQPARVTSFRNSDDRKIIFQSSAQILKPLETTESHCENLDKKSQNEKPKKARRLVRGRIVFHQKRPNLHTSQDNMLYNGSRIPVNMPIDSYRNMHMPEFFGQSMKSSRSHESLLSFSGTNHVSDLKQPDLRIHPVHPSVLEVDNCFKVANSYYVCESPQERTRWLENMRRAINPHLDERRRTENSFQIWILEAKGIPQKRRYYCDLVLDSTLYAKTSTKTHSEHCFWGDFFDLKSLPPIRNAVINLYREQDPRKKKDHHTLIGQVTINIDQFKARQPLEKWFTVTTGQENTRSMLSKNSEPVAIRIKARYQTVDVLPLIVYNRLNNFVKLNYLCLCEHLESALGVKLKEDFATCLVKVLHRQRVVKDFLCDIIMAEVGQLDNDHLMFRGNSLATKSMEAYIKLVAADYLHNTLGKFVKSLVVNPPTCEVDPTKMSSNSTTALNANRKRLMDAVEQAWGCIVKSASIFPQQLREVFHALRRRLDEQGKGQLGDKLVSASIFLRFLCPAVLSPSLFGLVSEYPSEQAARNLTLIAKTLQTLANFTKFGGKESFMEFMNNFIIKETRPMHSFLVGISHPPLLNEKAITASNNDIDSEIDQGKELSCLHSYLEEHWTNELHEKASQIDENMGQLQAIIAEIDMCKTREYTPQSTFSSYSSRQSTSPPSDYENNVKPAPPPKRSQRQAAMNLNTVDDYVMGTAVTPESSSRSKSQQRFFYRDMSEGREGLAKRYSMPYHNIYDITPSARDGYHLYDEVSQDDLKADELTNVSLDPADDEATDSETEGHVDRRITPRKTRRKSYMTDMRIDMIDPESRRLGLPSSGYQSQNQSCYSSSSNSPNDTFGKEKSHGDSQKYSNYLKDNLSYHTATTTSCSSTSSGHNDVEDKRPYQLSRSQTGHERIPYTKTRSNYRARSVVAQLPDQEPRLSNSTSCQSINGRVAIKDEDLSLIETQKRQIDELLRENENLKRALAEHHGSHVELTARPIPNQPFSVQLSPF
uniref:Ras-GAP domain-containing protein n=1 Tax=Bursaphelenchus xylophilus TaxID=6326 RepID=A0A1I7S9Q5_BURXY